MEEKQIVCINCPLGCRITVTMDGNEIKKIEGNTCKRGEVYARQEVLSPVRVITAVLPVEGSPVPVSVKTAAPIPKNKIFECMAEMGKTSLKAPIHMGDVIVPNILGTGVNVVATKSVG
ncbi:MAG: DUF1667 domain-containing protein [Clostridia bacterium]|jgi:CxxC motif-containing protein|nr:DUF1667 domain-containing protein [Clostridia bacterium]